MTRKTLRNDDISVAEPALHLPAPPPCGSSTRCEPGFPQNEINGERKAFGVSSKSPTGCAWRPAPYLFMLGGPTVNALDYLPIASLGFLQSDDHQCADYSISSPYCVMSWSPALRCDKILSNSGRPELAVEAVGKCFFRSPLEDVSSTRQKRRPTPSIGVRFLAQFQAMLTKGCNAVTFGGYIGCAGAKVVKGRRTFLQ